MWVRRTSLWRHCLAEVELQFNVKLSSPGKTRSVRSAHYTPAQTLPSCCNMSGRDEGGIASLFSVVIREGFHPTNTHRNKEPDAHLVGQSSSIVSHLSALPASFEVFSVRASSSSLSHPLSFPVMPPCSSISLFLLPLVCVIALLPLGGCVLHWKVGRRPELVIL